MPSHLLASSTCSLGSVDVCAHLAHSSGAGHGKGASAEFERLPENNPTSVHVDVSLSMLSVGTQSTDSGVSLKTVMSLGETNSTCVTCNSEASDARDVHRQESAPNDAQQNSCSSCQPPSPLAFNPNSCTELLSEPRPLVEAESKVKWEPGTKDVQLGDVVLLSNRVPKEYSSSQAVVTKVAEAHCTVVVLDESQCSGLGECWPGFQDMTVMSRAWRLGTRVVIGGMQGDRTKHLNGFTGVVSQHPRQGHPAFIRKQTCPNIPQLVLCIVFDNPDVANLRSALLEPRFLKPLDSAAEEVVKCLSEAIARLSSEDT